jgi:Lrp/AsnC family transcriptional regulator
MSGDVDYLLHVVVPDIASYDAFYKKLISRVEVAKVSSAFAMERIKYTTALPLDFALGTTRGGSPARTEVRGQRETTR